jgi:hypothetical protein
LLTDYNTVDEAETVPALGTYSVIVSRYPGTGSISYPVSGSPFASGNALLIERTTMATQLAQLRNQGRHHP